MNRFLVLCLTLLLPGCAMLSGFSARPASTTVEAVAVTPDQARRMAADLARLIADTFPPARTTLIYTVTEQPLSAAVDRALRQQGFALTGPDAGDDHPALQYQLDRFHAEPRAELIYLSVGAGHIRAGRAYYRSDSDFRPVNAFTVRRQY